MVSFNDERPNWIYSNDPFFTMFSRKCINRMAWLLKSLPTTPPMKEGKPISVLEFFLSMEEEIFWSVMDHCPDCTAYILFDMRSRYRRRKVDQSVNMANQDDVDIDVLFQSILKNLSDLPTSNNKKLLRGKHAEGLPLELSRSKRTKFMNKKNKIRITSQAFH